MESWASRRVERPGRGRNGGKGVWGGGGGVEWSFTPLLRSYIRPRYYSLHFLLLLASLTFATAA